MRKRYTLRSGNHISQTELKAGFMALARLVLDFQGLSVLSREEFDAARDFIMALMREVSDAKEAILSKQIDWTKEASVVDQRSEQHESSDSDHGVDTPGARADSGGAERSVRDARAERFRPV